jgi:hypothetical protein
MSSNRYAAQGFTWYMHVVHIKQKKLALKVKSTALHVLGLFFQTATLRHPQNLSALEAWTTLIWRKLIWLLPTCQFNTISIGKILPERFHPNESWKLCTPFEHHCRQRPVAAAPETWRSIARPGLQAHYCQQQLFEVVSGPYPVSRVHSPRESSPTGIHRQVLCPGLPSQIWSGQLNSTSTGKGTYASERLISTELVWKTNTMSTQEHRELS